MENLNKTVKTRMDALRNSERTFKDIYDIMFSVGELTLCEYTDGYRIKSMTYAQYADIIPRAAAVIARLFPERGYIALAMENAPEWVTLFWAILMSGHDVMLVNMRLPMDTSRRAIKRVGAVGVISAENADYGMESVTVEDVLSRLDVPISPVKWGGCIALFTSGTTLHEKVCVYTGEQIAAQVLNSEAVVYQNAEIKRRYKGQMKQLAFLPFYHIYGFSAVYMWFGFFGRTFVFLRDYSGDTILKTVRKHGVTHIFAVPMLWHTIEKEVLSSVAARDEKTQAKFKKGLKICEGLQNAFPRLGQRLSQRILSQVTDEVFGRSVKFCISGGSYLRPSAQKLINALGYPLYNGYGMTEIGITSVELRKKPKYRNLCSIGKPFGSVDYKLTNEGELCVNGSSIFTGMYLDGVYMPFDDEWFFTGDLAYTDEKGYYYLKGRRGDCVIGEDGENLNPDEIERLLMIDHARRYSVLGMDMDGTERLALIIEPDGALTSAHVKSMMFSLYEQLKKLPAAYRISAIYFADGALASEMDIKVSRAGLKRRIEQGSVKLTDAAGYLKRASSMTAEEQQSEITDMVCAAFSDILKKDISEIKPDSHFIFDLGGNSMEYLTLVHELEDRFKVHIGVDEENYCATPAEFSAAISSRLKGGEQK